MIDKLLVSLRNIYGTLYHAAFPRPFLISLAVACFVLVLRLGILKYKDSAFKLEKHTFFSSCRYALCAFLTVLYFLMLVQITLTNRLYLDYTIDPLSNPWGGWYIRAYCYSYDYTPLGNFMLFTPIAFLLGGFFKNAFAAKKRGVLLTVGVGFGLSLCVELAQLVFALGTFQVSDLFYNTLGSLGGALLFLAVKKASRKR